MNIRITKDHVFVQTPFEYRDFVQSTLNGVWSKKYKAYRFPKNIHAMRELMAAFPMLQVNPEFIATGKGLSQARQQALQVKSLTDTSGESRLRPYQRADIAYLKTLPSAGIFNEPRTGKTPVSIQLIKELGTKRNLIIAPASLIWNWKAEFEKWWPEIDVYVISGTPKQREQDRILSQKHSVLIVSKDTWKVDYKAWENYEFDTVFVDEAHYLRNYKTTQSKAIFSVKAARRYTLTGTPTVKSGTDIWGILHFLYPAKFNSYWQFVERYFQVGEDFMGHKVIGNVKPERDQELKELIGFISVQRKRKEVMSWLPDKEYTTFHCKMEGKQVKLYERMAEDFIAYLDDSDHRVDTSNVLTQLIRLRQLVLDPRLIGFDVGSAKTKALTEYLDDNREPTVIMSMFTSYLKLLKPQLQELGLRVGEINGEMANGDKQRTAEMFQKGQIDVLLCNIISAGTGFTLDRAETVIFTDKAWNPAENSQAEDRITPVSKERNHKHTIITFECDDSFDQRINRLLENKKSLTDVINEGGRDAIRSLLM